MRTPTNSGSVPEWVRTVLCLSGVAVILWIAVAPAYEVAMPFYVNWTLGAYALTALTLAFRRPVP